MRNKVKFVWYFVLSRLSVVLNYPLGKPTSVMFNITPNCVLKCKHCDIWRNKSEKQITFDEAKKIIDNLYNWLGPFYFFFTGGEPLINKDLPKMLRYCHSLGINTHVNSNASLITDVLAKELVNSHLSAISISIDGAKPETHDLLRGVKGTHKKAINAIRLLNKYKKNRKSPTILINTVIMRPNLDELVDLASLSLSEKTDGITYQCLLPNFGIIHDSNDNLNLWPEKKRVIKTLNRVIKFIPKNKIVLSTPQFLESAIQYYTNPNYINTLKCTAGINSFIVDHKGGVRLCFQYPLIGNIFKQKSQDLWKNAIAQKQRQIIKNCTQPCKIMACNRIDNQRQQSVGKI